MRESLFSLPRVGSHGAPPFLVCSVKSSSISSHYHFCEVSLSYYQHLLFFVPVYFHSTFLSGIYFNFNVRSIKVCTFADVNNFIIPSCTWNSQYQDIRSSNQTFSR